MIEVTVKFIYGDYMIDWQEQEYHDERVSNFKWAFETIIKAYNESTIIPLTIDCEYYPATQKFKIVNFTKVHRVRIDRQLSMNPQFVREYLKQ